MWTFWTQIEVIVDISIWIFVVNTVLLVAGGLGALVVKDIMQNIKNVQRQQNELPMLYVLKDDYHKDIDDIKEMLKEIYAELRKKQDKRNT